MKILIPATRSPAWRGGDVVMLDPDDEAYWRFWVDVWRNAETVIVVEHDIKPSRAAIADIGACPNDWCTQPYPYINGHHAGLGCVKFTGRLMTYTPYVWERVAARSNDRHVQRHWCTLDAYLQQELNALGHQPCRHSTLVKHLNTGQPSHGCY